MPPDSGGPDAATPQDDRVIVGRIRGVRGLRGELRVEPLTDSPARFAPGSVLFIDEVSFRVQRSHPAKVGLVVKLDSVNDRNAAEALRDSILTIPAEQVAPLPESSYYHFQIIDMAVLTDEGVPLGYVREILSTGTNDVYVVRDESGSETLVPAVADVVLDVDLDRNTMTVRMPQEA